MSLSLALLGMCLAAIVLETCGVSDVDKKVILDAHNGCRRGVSPTATNMLKMYWSDGLESAAQTWVNKCIVGHDNNDERRQSANIGAQVGQNFAQAWSWAQSIKLWHDEVQFFDYDTQATNTIGETVGHYTQVVWSESSLVGCAMANCGTKKHYICNYAYGNMQGQKNYNNGASCADCQGKCDDKLCDCPEGKICKNGGSLNLNDCSCTCSSGFTGDSCDTCLNSCQNGGTLMSDCTCDCDPAYTGDLCQNEFSCSDDSVCGKVRPYGYPDDAWCQYTNVPPLCPKMCGIC